VNRGAPRQRGGRRAALLLAAVGCASAPERAADEVDARDLRLPPGAQTGMLATWTHRGSGGPDEDLAVETLACVERTAERVTMEWRREMRDGRREVIAARFRPDGTLLGAWRGPPGGTGEPLRIVFGEFDAEEAQREVERLAAPLGLSPDDVESSSTTAHEVVETPAGRFRCTVVRHEASLLFAEARVTWAYTDTPLPLTSVVRMEWRGAGMDYVQELAGFAETGAVPSLSIPP
jgi:hypothetical protein